MKILDVVKGHGALRVLAVSIVRRKAVAHTGSGTFTHSPLFPFQESPMLHYAVVFFVIALVAALFGFGGIATSAAGIGKILFIIFIILALASFLYGLIRKG